MAVVQLVLDYYFQKVSIPPQDVSQDLFKVNLTDIVSDLSEPTLATFVSVVTTSGGQALVSTASASDQAAINALSSRLTSLSNNLTTLDDQILVRSQARAMHPALCQTPWTFPCSPASEQWSLHLRLPVTFLLSLQASNFAGIVNGVQSLICCSATNGLWNLWLASIITGAVAAVLGMLALIKVVTAIHPLGRNHHYTPHDPNGTISSSKVAAT